MNDVRDEALAATLERTVGTIESTSLDRFEEILQRGRRRRAVRSSVVISAVIVFVGAVTWTGLHWLQPGDDPVVSADTGEPPDMVRTLHDTEHGFTFSVPEDWVVADANLTPWLSSPVEILSVGTFPLRVSDDPDAGLRLFDAPVAPQALAEMSSTDVFVSLQESGERFMGPPLNRPEHFELRDCDLAVTGCQEDQYRDIPFRAWWVPFQDAGRDFYLFVAIGNDASPELRDQVWTVADSLVFEPIEP